VAARALELGGVARVREDELLREIEELGARVDSIFSMIET
jgi:hypothetical protein